MGTLSVESRKPMLATGKIISDYRPLIKYLEVAGEEERNKVLPKGSDIELVRVLLEQGYGTVDEMLNQIIRVVKNRFNPELSRRVIREVLNIEIEEEEAVNHLSKLLAGWIIEMAEQLGVIRLKSTW